MTSANLSDRPIIHTNEEALEQLTDIADGFLLHNRDIVTRCDDSLMWVFEDKPYPVRRSRGFVPMPLLINKRNPAEQEPSAAAIEDNAPAQNEKASAAPCDILACGAEQKASFTLVKGNLCFPS